MYVCVVGWNVLFNFGKILEEWLPRKDQEKSDEFPSTIKEVYAFSFKLPH